MKLFSIWFYSLWTIHVVLHVSCWCCIVAELRMPHLSFRHTRHQNFPIRLVEIISLAIYQHQQHSYTLASPTLRYRLDKQTTIEKYHIWTRGNSPRSKMRLTADLIRDSLSYLNPLKERELDLRGAFEKSRCYTFWSLESAELIQSSLRREQATEFPRLRTWVSLV